GILAIAALKLGAKQAIGIDIDPQAIEASVENAKRNNVQHKLQLYLAGQQPTDLQADIVVANILAGPLQTLAHAITILVKPGGLICLSGILTSQAENVNNAYCDNFEMDQIVIDDEWCRLSGKCKFY